MGVGELNDGGCVGVCCCRATSMTGVARGRRRVVVEDGWESRGRRVAIRVVLCDTLAAGTTAKEIRKD